MKINTGPKLPEVNGNRYKMLAIAVCRDSHIGLAEALQLSLVEAYLALGANFGG
jgi:hypothetical protein